jgi:extracellular factor (EF) 3-hydroxypalmitic acid methyl ester biosynthesis protein
MNNEYSAQAAALSLKTEAANEITSELQAETAAAELNRMLLKAATGRWHDCVVGRRAAELLVARFIETVAALERWGWTAGNICRSITISRHVLATSAFIRRCQEWPRGYTGDFETVEYMMAGENGSVPGTIGWHIEDLLLQSRIVRQHRNKLACQASAIGAAISRSRSARVLSLGCGGCLDWLPLLRSLSDFEGEIVLNDYDDAALDLAAHRLRSATTQFRLAPGNVIRVVARLAQERPFDVIVAGGLFDYLADKWISHLLRVISERLLAPGGALLFTNIATGNPLRVLMEYGSNWRLIERSEEQVRALCTDSGIAESGISIERENTGLTLIARVRAANCTLGQCDGNCAGRPIICRDSDANGILMREHVGNDRRCGSAGWHRDGGMCR